MKNMHFLLPRRHRTFRPSYLATTVAIIAAVLIAIVQPHWLDALFLQASGGMFAVHAELVQGSDGVQARLMSKQDFATENQMLREENTRLAVRATLYDEVIAERDRIFQRFGRDPLMTGVLARVVAAPSRSPYDVILIDVGTDDGISEGDEAWFDTTLMLGTVESVSSDAARVRLFSSPGVETPVMAGTSTEALFTAIGSGGGAFEVSIPKDIPVTVGDALMLPTEGHGTLGFVREVTSHDTDSFQTVRAILPINLFETREVLIRSVGR